MTTGLIKFIVPIEKYKTCGTCGTNYNYNFYVPRGTLDCQVFCLVSPSKVITRNFLLNY